ncbi:MAG: hypothetical protein RJB57_675, partial [Actinomycetota bacterium]
MADALASGASVRKDVGVQVPPRAPAEDSDGTILSVNTVMRSGKVLLATRNEMVTLPLVLEEIADAAHGLGRLGWRLKVVIVDDSDLPEVHEALPALRERLGLEIELVQGKRRGLGAAVIQGFRHCLSDPSTEFIVNLDADGQHDARQMGDLLRIFAATGAGITIGSRWTEGGRCYGLTFARRVLSRCSSYALRKSGVPKDVMDPTTSFRVYSRRAAEILSREVLGFNGFSFFGAGIAVAAAHGLVVNETPIHFRPRVGGQSNLSARQTLRAVRDLPRIRAHWSMVRRREHAFESIKSNPAEYTASRELEQLSNTPVSTRIIVDMLEPHIGHNVLEIGAGLGLITSSLLGRDRKVTAVEPDPNLFARLIENPDAASAGHVNATLASWHDAEGMRGSFDTVLYVNVLEHIENDVDELSLASGMCTPDGNIVVFVPATPSLYGTMDWMSAHFRRYRMAELETVAKFADLDVVESFYFDPVGKFPYWMMYRVLK